MNKDCKSALRHAYGLTDSKLCKRWSPLGDCISALLFLSVAEGFEVKLYIVGIVYISQFWIGILRIFQHF